jgi:putative Holliday junction resolvase
MTNGTFLGFDAGTHRLGVAVGESLTGSARPLSVVRCRDGQPDWSAVMQLVEQWRPSALVVGRPLHDDGSASHSTGLSDRFARRLAGRSGLPVHRIDERLSSREAGWRLQQSGHGRRERRGTPGLDAVAAQVILETWFSEQESTG